MRSKDDILIKLEEINKELKMLKINMNKNKDNPMLYRNQLSNKSVLEGQRDFIKYWLLNDNIVKSKKEVLNFLVKVDLDVRRDISIFCVFDGHYGRGILDFVKKHF